MFKKIFSTPKAKMYGIVASALLVFLLVFIIITVSIPDSGRLRYELKMDGTYEVTDIKDLYRGGIFMRKKLVVPSEYNGKPVTSIKKIESIALKELVLPETLKNITSGSFIGMTSLEKVNIPEGVKKIGVNAFANCTNLKNITIPSSVVEISGRAFYMTGLTEITIPSSVKKIGSHAFELCKNLEKVELDFENTEVGVSTFEQTKFSEKVYAENNGFFIVNGVLYGIKIDESKQEGTKKDGFRVVIPESVEVIGNGVFNENTYVAYVSLPSTLRKINKNAFLLIDIQGKNKIKAIGFKNCNFEIDDEAVVDCTMLKAVVYDMNKEDINTDNLKNTKLSKLSVVYLQEGNYCVDVVDKDGTELTLLYDMEQFKPYRLVDGQKQYFNTTKKDFE